MTDRSRPIEALRNALAVLVIVGGTAFAQDADLDLKPADFMPDETVAIRVDGLRAGTSGTEVAVSVANRGKEAVVAAVECSLFDADREDLGLAAGSTARIPPGETVAAIASGMVDGAQRAYCRVANVR